MRLAAFLLGLYSVGGQVLLLREIIAAFHGDELLIGTALFGWLLSVAVGAHLGGRRQIKLDYRRLFLIGSILLPVIVVVIRLLPLALADVAGAQIPFASTAVASLLVMLPIGLVSGASFPAVTRRGLVAGDSIVAVYLFEGIGAFCAGLAVAFIVGTLVSTLAFSLCLAITIIVATLCNRRILSSLLAVSLIVASLIITPTVDRYLEKLKYSDYTIETTFETPYGRETILSRDNSTVLVTDNYVEASYPNIESAENALLPALYYSPDASQVLLIGRAEFGIAQLAEKLPQIKLTAVDPRGRLGEKLKELRDETRRYIRISDDPVSYFADSDVRQDYDIILLNCGELDNYRSTRYLSESFLQRAKRLLASDGILCIPTHYDTERYVSPATAPIISSIHSLLQNTFQHVEVWPGTTTLFFATDGEKLNIPLVTLMRRPGDLSYWPRYLDENSLFDRLETFRRERLTAALDSTIAPNSITRPILTHYQFNWRAKEGFAEKLLMSLVTEQRSWLLAFPIAIAVFFLTLIFRRNRRSQYALFLYFVAGIISLSLELLSFYLYQSVAGSLYSNLAILIGAFMLGLSFGTWYSRKAACDGLENIALLMLLFCCLILLFTWQLVPAKVALLYHSLFLLAVAVATATLFVGATKMLYPPRSGVNRGSGYAFEILGSAIGALLCTTILLPAIGLVWLLLSLALLAVIALAGSLATGR